ncbi:MAG TPA: hypothetical protein ENN79_04700 [Desulfobacteraceae bacterium]|nr:hypothetical protein [Desulfobacteraceae bacterium]
MTLKLDQLVQRESGEGEVDADGIAVPVKALAALRQSGYEQIRPYKSENTISAWGKTCSGCFTQAQLRRMAQ